MQKNTGVWVDHRRAVIVSLAGENESVETVESDVESQPTDTTGGRGAHPGNPTKFPEGRAERNFDQHLKKFYSDVESKLDGAAKILIIGPGQAKTEFKKHLEHNKRFADIPVEVEPADRMDQQEVARKIREYFHQPQPS